MAKTKHPNYIDKANSVTSLFTNPCNAPWVVYAETALPILGTAVIRLFDFGMGDIIRGAARPANKRVSRHFRRPGKNWKRFSGIPELGNIVGKTLGGGEVLNQRKVSDGIRHLWVIDGIIQKYLLRWLIADIIQDSYYAWTTAIMDTSCGKQPQKGNAFCRTIDNATFFTPGNAWASVPTGLVDYQEDGAFARFGAHWGSGRPFVGISVLKGSQGLLPGGYIQVGIRASDGGHAIIGSGATNDPQNVFAVLESSGPPIIFDYRTNGGSFVGEGYSTTFAY